MDEAEKAGGGVVVSRGHAAGVFQAVEAPLDAVAQRTDVAVDRLANASALPVRDDGHAAARVHVLPDDVGTVSAIGEQNPRGGPLSGDQRAVSLIVRYCAGGDLDGYGQSGTVHAEMEFGQQAAARAPETPALCLPPCARS